MSDLISREDALTALNGACSNWEDDSQVADIINRLPSAEGGDAETNPIPEGTGLMQPSPNNGADLISRADAIEAVRKKLQDWGGYAFEDYRRGLYEAQDILSALPSAEAVQGWIPCSERLPKVGENVLFTTDIYGGYVAEGDRRADGKWWQYRWNSLLQNDEVVAWMPLPKPYKGGEDE